MRAHQRESQTCRPRSGPGDSSTVKALEAKLAEVIAEGKKLGSGGCTLDESEKNEAHTSIRKQPIDMITCSRFMK